MEDQFRYVDDDNNAYSFLYSCIMVSDNEGQLPENWSWELREDGKLGLVGPDHKEYVVVLEAK